MLRVGVSSRRSSPCAHRALISFSTCFPYRFPLCPAVIGTKQARRSRADPERATRAGTPGAAAPVRSTPGWDAGTLPGRAAALEGRARYRPPPPPGEAGWTSPHAPYSQRKCVPEKFPAQAQAAQSARPILTIVYRLTKSRAPGDCHQPRERCRPLERAAGQRPLRLPGVVADRAYPGVARLRRHRTSGLAGLSCLTSLSCPCRPCCPGCPRRLRGG